MLFRKQSHSAIFKFSSALLSVIIVASCNNEPKITPQVEEIVTTPIIPEPIEIKPIDYDTSQWKEIAPESGVVIDLRYATENNFTKEQIYDCPRCFLRPVLAKKLLDLQVDIKERYGLGLKVFDCYRPRPAQQKLWDIVPDARYVTPPSKGSMHNRGLAVDITLVDNDGNELDMGTEYDHFGYSAYTTNKDLPETVLKNRSILTKLMEVHGLKGIRTEWWHFSLKTQQAPFDNWEWACD